MARAVFDFSDPEPDPGRRTPAPSRPTAVTTAPSWWSRFSAHLAALLLAGLLLGLGLRQYARTNAAAAVGAINQGVRAK
jgi:hypothetical protein